MKRQDNILTARIVRYAASILILFTLSGGILFFQDQHSSSSAQELSQSPSAEPTPQKKVSQFITTMPEVIAPGMEQPVSILQQSQGQDRAIQLTETAKRQLYAMMIEKQSRTAIQQKIDSQLLFTAKVKSQQTAPEIAALETDITYDEIGRVEVDISAVITKELLVLIEREGGNLVNSYPQFNSLRAYLLLESLETIAALDEVRFISRAANPVLSSTPTQQSTLVKSPFDRRAQRIREQISTALLTNSSSYLPVLPAPVTGSVTSEGDIAHRANQARSSFSVTGAGVKIGVLSDSVKFLSQSQASGNLGTVTILSNRSGAGGTLDKGEGTAMLEIIHDLAPGAQLFFSTANGGPAAFAQNILDLRAVGCNIIVDDIEYSIESPFQDDIVAQAVNIVTADGALYFSAAGNSGNFNDFTSSVWENDFSDAGPVSVNGVLVGNANRFSAPDRTLNPVFSQNPAGEIASLFWSDPLSGSSNDYDLYVVNSSGTIVYDRSSNNPQTGAQPPIEVVRVFDGESLLVVKYRGANRYLHLNVGGDGSFLGYATAGRTKGHSAAANAFSVAAVDANRFFPSPFVGGFSNPVEKFSSDGPRRLFYSANGVPFTPGNFSSTGGTVRIKPDIAAADRVSTSTPGFQVFSGTSAAAPHAAAIAGLLLSYNPSLTPSQIRTVLTSTALDIEAPGVDRDSGAGIVMAQQALQFIGGTGCNYSISPASQGFAAAGGNSTVGVTATAGCSWTAASNASWLTITSGTTGNGNGTVGYTVAANTGATRTGTLTVAGQIFTVTQSASSGGGCPSTVISFGQTISGSITTSDCIFAGTTRYVDVYNFSGTAGQQIAVAMNSSIFDTFLILLNSSNQTLAENDNGGGGTNSRIPATPGFFTLPATGTYTIYATSYSASGTTGSTGAYTISLFSAVRAKTVGVFRPSNGIVYLKNANSGGFADLSLVYGNAGDQPIAGDWNGDGVDSLGIYRNGVFYLRNANTTGPANIVFPFGAAGDIPIAGDWNGDGIDTIGVYRQSTGVFYLRNTNTAGGADVAFVLGNPGDVPIAGDWNGDGVTTTGVFRPTNGIIYLKNTNVSGNADIGLVYGNAGDKPVAGDWNGDGVDTVGIYRGGLFYLRNTNTQGVADLVFALGNDGDVPLAGDWDGLP